MVDHVGQVVQQAYSDSPVRIREESNDYWSYPRLPILVRKLFPYLHYRREYFRPSAAKFNRLQKFREDFDTEEFFRKIIGDFVQLAVFWSAQSGTIVPILTDLKNSSRSPSLFSPRLSNPSDSLIRGVSKKPPLRLPWSRKWETLSLAFGFEFNSLL